MPRVTKKKKRGGGSILGKIDLREIRLTAMNDYGIYKQADAFALNYAIKKEKGVYNRRLAIKGIANNLAPRAIRNAGITARTTQADKNKVGQILLRWIDDMVSDIRKNERARLPKKYQRKKKKKVTKKKKTSRKKKRKR